MEFCQSEKVGTLMPAITTIKVIVFARLSIGAEELRLPSTLNTKPLILHCGAVREGNAIAPGCIGGIRQGELVLRNPTDKIFLRLIS